MRRIAVDFGTSNTAIAVQESDSEPAKTVAMPGISSSHHYRLTGEDAPRTAHVIPTIIHYADGATFVGRQVHDRDLAHHPETFRWMKRSIALGVNKRRKTKQGHKGPRQAAEDFLSLLLRYVAPMVSFADDEFVFTAPVEAFEDFEDWLRGVAEAVGIQRSRIVDEATACILGYQGSVRPEERFVVFDFGSGTLDVSAVRLDLGGRTDRTAVQLGKAGRDLGGMDIDAWIMNDFVARHSLDIRSQRNVEPALLLEAERVKIELSTPQRESSTFRLESTDASTDGKASTIYARRCSRCATRRDLPGAEACLGCLLGKHDFRAQVRATVERALENAAVKAGLRRDDVTRVLMTGGSSLIPSVRALLREMFEDRIGYQSPFDATACGACRGGVIPILQHDYAIESFDRERRDYEFKALLSAGMEYPTKPAVARFWARGSHDGMTRIGIRVFEVSAVKERSFDQSLVDAAGVLRDPCRVATDRRYICLNRENPTFIVADPPIDLGRDNERFECAFRVDGHRRLLVTVTDHHNGAKVLEDAAVVRL